MYIHRCSYINCTAGTRKTDSKLRPIFESKKSIFPLRIVLFEMRGLVSFNKDNFWIFYKLIFRYYLLIGCNSSSVWRVRQGEQDRLLTAGEQVRGRCTDIVLHFQYPVHSLTFSQHWSKDHTSWRPGNTRLPDTSRLPHTTRLPGKPNQISKLWFWLHV